MMVSAVFCGCEIWMRGNHKNRIQVSEMRFQGAKLLRHTTKQTLEHF